MASLLFSMNFQARLKLFLKKYRDPDSGKSLDESPHVHFSEGREGFSLILEVSDEHLLPWQSLATALREDCSKNDLPVHVLMTKTKAAPLSQIKKIIAVASGKGGVGKSTISVQMAAAFKRQGLKVGLLDADIYGPSLPKMTGVSKEDLKRDETKLTPPQKFGLYVMSMGFFVEEEAPLIWRGPMVQKAVQQLFFDVAWPPLDVLIVDLPPGTGDAQLTLAQKIPLSGIVIVSTPQDIALLDARKALRMFKKLDVPVLGLLENMSCFECPRCHEKSAIFQEGTVRKEALKEEVPYLGALPLTLALREACDEGRPLESGVEDLMDTIVAPLIMSLGLDAEQSRESRQERRA